MEKKIKTLGVLHAKSFYVNLDEVSRGRSSAKRLVIRHPSAVVIVPVIGDDETLIVEQHRYSLGRKTLEFPAGKIDPGEDPLETAKRELIEETGYRAGRFDRLLSFAPSLGYSDEIIHVFRARDLEPTGNEPDENEISRVIRIRISELQEMIMSGNIIDGTTMTALAVLEWSGGGD